MTWENWIGLCGTIAATAGVVLAYCDYFRRRRNELKARQEQREYELVRQRYLDEGFDQLIANVQKSLSTYQWNSSVAVSILKQYHNFEEGMKKPDPSVFRPISFDEMDMKPVHRVCRLIADDVVWSLVQLLSAFTYGAHFDFEHDLAGGLSMILDHGTERPELKEEAFNAYKSLLSQLSDRANKYYAFLSYLHKLCTLFERTNFTFTTISSFSEREEVRSIVVKLSELKSEIEEQNTQARNERQQKGLSSEATAN